MELKKKEKEKISILLEDLTSLESYASDLFNFLPVPVFLSSPIKVILEVNPAFEKITGYKIEEIIGKPIKKFLDQDKTEALIKETLAKGFAGARETILFIKGKKALPVSVSTMLRKNEEGEAVGYFFGFFDLTEVKKKEKKLEEKIEELESFHRLAIGRELKIVELKEEIEKLKSIINKSYEKKQ